MHFIYKEMIVLYILLVICSFYLLYICAHIHLWCIYICMRWFSKIFVGTQCGPGVGFFLLSHFSAVRWGRQVWHVKRFAQQPQSKGGSWVSNAGMPDFNPVPFLLSRSGKWFLPNQISGSHPSPTQSEFLRGTWHPPPAFSGPNLYGGSSGWGLWKVFLVPPSSCSLGIVAELLAIPCAWWCLLLAPGSCREGALWRGRLSKPSGQAHRSLGFGRNSCYHDNCGPRLISRGTGPHVCRARAGSGKLWMCSSSAEVHRRDRGRQEECSLWGTGIAPRQRRGLRGPQSHP